MTTYQFIELRFGQLVDGFLEGLHKVSDVLRYRRHAETDRHPQSRIHDNKY